MANLSRVVRVRNSNYKPSGIKSYVYALQKYGISPTVDGPYFVGDKELSHGCFGVRNLIHNKKQKPQRALQKRSGNDGEPGEVTAEDQQNDSMYLCSVDIGTPAQTLLLDFDTGSSDLWTMSSELPMSKLHTKQKHTFYDPSKSSTSEHVKGATWSISYGDGSSASGDVYSDNVTVGGLTIEGQAVECAKKISPTFASSVGDGLLGLAFSSINTVKPHSVQTPVDNMISQKDISEGQELFTAYLTSWRQADKDSSFYTFGYIDNSILADAGVTEPYFTNVDNSQGFWMFSSASATINGKAISRNGNTAIADTGTTLALVDDSTCKAIYAKIPGARFDSANQGFTFPANTQPSKLPVVTFDVGGKQFAMPKEALAFADAGNGTVYGGVQSRGDLPFDILGDAFLKGIYAIFDQGKTRFGAVQRPDPTGETLMEEKPVQSQS